MMGPSIEEPTVSPPLSPAVFHILLTLAGGDRHGYAVCKEVEERTGGSIRLGSGVFYRTVRQLLAEGWVEEAGERIDTRMDDQRRRYYRLTDLGWQAGEAEAQRLSKLVDLARSRQFLRGWEGAG